MEVKTLETLRMMICGELEDIAKKGSLSHETLDVMKDLLQSEHYINKIEAKEKESQEMMDQGYSQRKYYIDADYDPYHSMNSYAHGGREMDKYPYGYSMNRQYDGNSYLYYDPRYEQAMYPMNKGYSRTGSKTEMVEELRKMMEETTDETVKKAISEAVSKLK